jgi:hypothetical protein
MDWVALIVGFAVLLLFFGVPGYVIGKRRGVSHPWIAFLPILGIWIVLLEAIGKNGWYSLLAFVPYVGPIALLIWTAVELPARHGRSRWWTLPLIVPVVNIIGYWWYAFTLSGNEPASPYHSGQLSLQ